jgi:hypothetical protein
MAGGAGVGMGASAARPERRRAAELRRRNAFTRFRPRVWLGFGPEDSACDGEPNWGVEKERRGP